MKVYGASEAEIDRRLALDKRKFEAAFCRGFNPKSEVEITPNFCDFQDKIRDGLEQEFFARVGDGIDRSKLDTWKLSGSHPFFYFPAELIPSERIIIELSSEILDDRLLAVILAYLERCQFPYCVIVAVFSGGKMTGKNYLGRFVVNLEEIAVEKSLVETWSKKVRFLEIEQ
jgi:hypothetical protein